jgi:hypothetical protein
MGLCCFGRKLGLSRIEPRLHNTLEKGLFPVLQWIPQCLPHVGVVVHSQRSSVSGLAKSR